MGGLEGSGQGLGGLLAIEERVVIGEDGPGGDGEVLEWSGAPGSGVVIPFTNFFSKCRVLFGAGIVLGEAETWYNSQEIQKPLCFTPASFATRIMYRSAFGCRMVAVW